MHIKTTIFNIILFLIGLLYLTHFYKLKNVLGCYVFE